jgi:GTP-binding protein
MDIRNIAIIAHVDHGKTTLTDALLRQTGMVTAEGVTMDSNALEQERGITIYAKNTSLYYKDTKINIVDTPGHADFGSEVERVLRAIDSVLLVVDAQEGPMPQTRFVLKKSLELGLRPIVVINKIDKPAARPKEVVDEVLELFFDLGANEKQLDFPVVYAIGRQGIAKLKLEEESANLNPLLDTILKEVPAANTKAGNASADGTEPFVMQVFNLAYDNFLGRLAIGRVYGGVANDGQMVYASTPSGTKHSGKITKIFTFEGTVRKEIKTTEPGDIIMIAGLPEIYIGETVSTSTETAPLPAITIDEPTIAMNFLVNDSPFAGREGSLVTGRQIRERLERELEINVGLKVDFSSSEAYKVFGRGELHISILLENMRREGYEVQVSQPQVIIKEEGGKKMEPFEEAIIDVPSVSSSIVIEKLGRRRGILMSMNEEAAAAGGGAGVSRLIFEIPTRGLLGYRNEFIIDTKGEGILSSRFLEFRPHAGEIDHRQAGAMISMAPGKVLAFSLDNLQQRGVLYVEPGDEVYEGEVIGNTTKGEDLYVNPTKGKQLTNMRASGSDDSIYLAPAWTLSIERAMEIMGEDEYIEITPKNVRLRKKYLTKVAKDRAERSEK